MTKYFTLLAMRSPSEDSLSLRNITSPQELARASRSPLLAGALQRDTVQIIEREIGLWELKYHFESKIPSENSPVKIFFTL